jgi:catechol 2,3-dioxygenase-like lactoylglutathione lyase family enzyme
MQIRFARPTNNIPQLVTFYRKVLGWDVLAKFEDHDGFDGVILGIAGAAWHVEFTAERGKTALVAPSPDDLIALYLDDQEFAASRDRVLAAGVPLLASQNPYWDKRGAITIADPDGYRVVLVLGRWRS